jgi:SAM-dependent methyltransferase
MPRDAYLEPYRRAVDQFGDTFEVALWATPVTQLSRFEVFAQMGDLGGKRVLDAGCGRGDFAAWLVEQQIEFTSFVGVDGVPELIEFARARGLPRAEFRCGDLLNDADLPTLGWPQVICISGTLNTLTLRQAIDVLDSCWAATQELLMFNFLSDLASRRTAPQLGPARRLNTLKLLDWAARRSEAIVYRQDYLPYGHDGTICMRKSDGATPARSAPG